MKYFLNDGNVFGYDEADADQLPLIDAAIRAGWKDITGEWPPLPPVEELVAVYNPVILQWQDDVARAWGYDSILEAASYATSKVKKFKAEAAVLVAWRDEVWSSAETQSAKIANAGEKVSVEEFIARLPKQPTRPKSND